MIEISSIRATLDEGATEAGCLDRCRAEAQRLLRCRATDITEVELRRRSVDARRKRDVHLMLTVRVALADAAAEAEALSRAPARDQNRIRLVEPEPPHTVTPVRSGLDVRPVIVGAGCAGLFAALRLAEAGAAPLLIERGDGAERRRDAIDRFIKTGELDPESNIQFGLGGAGTFSDGKLTTGTKSPAHRFILEALVDAGAPRDILWDAKPHIGSDILPRAVTRLVERIRELGGEVRFRTRLVDIERELERSGAIRAVVVEHAASEGAPARCERIACRQLILACGHSARDVFELLCARGVTVRRKTFAMGVRIEHLQHDIDRAQYGASAGHPALGAAPYKLVAHLSSGRSLFSFCMCPGGEVVAAASEPGGVVTNGASLNARAGTNANAALLVNVTPDDLPGDDPLAAVHLQRSCERRAFELGGGGYVAPAQLVGDFLNKRPSEGAGTVAPTYPRGVRWCALDDALPDHIIDTLRLGIPVLSRKLAGFDAADAVLTGVESRSSSPVTVARDRTCEAEGTPGLYPAGEGAGYAGGIMSAATDGVRVADAVLACITSSKAARTPANATGIKREYPME